MPNILILINPAQYTYHATLSHMIQNFLQTETYVAAIFDISSCKRNYECLEKINQLQPDVLITLDLSGFQFRTQAGEIALNMLPTKNLNLVWGNKAEYAPLLTKKLSLSMLFYDATGEDYHFPQIYPNLLYYKTLAPLSCAPDSASSAFTNKEHFQQIWQDFTHEVLLFQE